MLPGKIKINEINDTVNFPESHFSLINYGKAEPNDNCIVTVSFCHRTDRGYLDSVKTDHINRLGLS